MTIQMVQVNLDDCPEFMTEEKGRVHVNEYNIHVNDR